MISEQFFESAGGRSRTSTSTTSPSCSTAWTSWPATSLHRPPQRRAQHRTLTGSSADQGLHHRSQAETRQAEDAARSARGAQKSLDEKVREVRGRKELDDRTREIKLPDLQAVANRRLAVKKAEIEDQKREDPGHQAHEEQAIRGIKGRVRTLAILAAPFPALILAGIVFGVRSGRENRGANPNGLALTSEVFRGSWFVIREDQKARGGGPIPSQTTNHDLSDIGRTREIRHHQRGHEPRDEEDPGLRRRRVVMTGAANLGRGDRSGRPEAFNDQGQKFFDDFDPNTCTTLEVIDYDPATASVLPFKVTNEGRQVGHPLALRLPGRRQAAAGQHRHRRHRPDQGLDPLRPGRGPGDLRRLDPLDTKANSLKGIGKRVTLKDASDKVLADFIIGKEVKDHPEQR